MKSLNKINTCLNMFPLNNTIILKTVLKMFNYILEASTLLVRSYFHGMWHIKWYPVEVKCNHHQAAHRNLTSKIILEQIPAPLHALDDDNGDVFNHLAVMIAEETSFFPGCSGAGLVARNGDGTDPQTFRKRQQLHAFRWSTLMPTQTRQRRSLRKFLQTDLVVRHYKYRWPLT